jgi:hypothetical protein
MPASCPAHDSEHTGSELRCDQRSACRQGRAAALGTALTRGFFARSLVRIRGARIARGCPPSVLGRCDTGRCQPSQYCTNHHDLLPDRHRFHPSLARSCACLTTKVLRGLRRTQFWKTLGGVLQAASARTDAEATAASRATIPLRRGHCARESHGASSLGYVSPPARRWAIGILSMLWLCTAISCAHRLVALNCASSRHPMFGRCVTMDTVFLSGERVGTP